MRDADAATRVAFARWQGESIERAVAYDAVRGAHDRVRSLAEKPPLLSLRQQTLARTMLARRPPRVRWRVVATGAVLLAAAPLAAYGIRAWTAPVAPPPAETFRTGIGQQADVTLADGSIVTLDTASTLQVRVSEGVRRVTLDGQGWFKVKPAAAPFEIGVRGRTFVATAGEFDVRTDPDRLRAFAASGTLRLVGDSTTLALPPGRAITVTDEDVTLRTPADATRFTGWRTGALQLDDVPLAEAVGEFNRYRRHPIRLADGRVGALRVSGAFRTTGALAFVDALAVGFPVRVKRDSDAGIVISAR
ncbi:FecR domain-containing protein [Sphingomonas sp. TREG-RG-20F-R18-01]|uniref:FecR family protein n=1 Tax=Sphingomonas sp. TREG-RG-20F-R18-01 TaxID=2914982 RepID=UPI001F5803AB|nr:FecR domain-containing protein [Sphingomonas sp. TREG-RG-20F-R18-01]